MEIQTANFVLFGKICTMRKSYQEPDWAEALAIRDDTIIYVGSRDGALNFISPHTEVIDVGDGTILPGFQDAHVHPLAAGLAQMQCVLSYCESLHEALQIISNYSQTHRQLDWITGFGISSRPH
jgi:predicted amidohydrolase YtcJ